MASKLQKKKGTKTSTKSNKSVSVKKSSSKKVTTSKKKPVTSKKQAQAAKKPKASEKKPAATLKKPSTRSKKPISSPKKVSRRSANTSSKKQVVTAKHPKREIMKKESKGTPKGPPSGRKATLRKILLAKRDAVSQAIKQQLGQSLTDEQQRRLESAMDSGDQALVDLDREMGISLQEMRNKERQQIEDSLVSLEEGTYGMCAECGEEISEKRLQALPFARLCVGCQTNRELMERIERAEQRS